MAKVITRLIMVIALILIPNISNAATDFGQTPNATEPWSCWYWPEYDTLNPNMYDAGEAMERYDQYDINAGAQAWERANHYCNSSDCGWYGHCHAWSGAAVWEPQPTAAKTLNGVEFRIRDRKALLVESYYTCAYVDKCEIWENSPSPGLFWRWLRDEIGGKNPMHGESRAFIGELYWEEPSEIGQVWNYPIYRYGVNYTMTTSASGTIKIWVAGDGNSAWADYVLLDDSNNTYIYSFEGVLLDGENPLDSGTWIGSGHDYRPDFIWRPYRAIFWNTYVENSALDEEYLSNILQSSVRSGFDAYSLSGNDDSSVGPVAIGFQVNFFGNIHTQLYINNNGNITFDSVQSTYTPYSLTSTTREIIAPFFADVDTRSTDVVTYGSGTVNGRAAFGVNWMNVGYFSMHSSPTNSFQLILIDRSDVNSGDFDIEFNYEHIGWETGDASGGSGGLGGSSARVGYSNGSGNPGTYYELLGSAINGAFLDGGPYALVSNHRNSTVRGTYLFEARSGTVTRPPSPLNGSILLLQR